jgi:hypothetical protein
MASIREILFDIAPEFETVDAAALARVDRFIERAAGEINRGVWGAKADEATALLAAHKLTLRGRIGNAAGPVVSRKNGDFSESYAAPQGSGADSSTSYGTEFARLRGTLAITPIVL